MSLKTFPIELGCDGIANGGREWFLVLDGTRIYPNEDRVGIFTAAFVSPAAALKIVLAAWGDRR